MVCLHTPKRIISFFAAYFLSSFGYQFTFFVLTVHIYNLTHNALNVGIFVAIYFIPRLFTPFLGIIVDSYSKEKVFTGAVGITALVVASMALSTNIPILFALWFFVSLLTALTANVRTTLMTMLMFQGSYLKGNSLVMIFINATKLLAPFLGGLTFPIFGAAPLLIVAGSTYFLSSLFCLRTVSFKNPASPVLTKHPWDSFKEGVHYLQSNPPLRFLTYISLFWGLFTAMQSSLYVVYIRSFLGRSDSDYGYFMTVAGIGSLIGSLAGPHIVKQFDHVKTIVAGLLFNYAAFVLLGIYRNYAAALILVFSMSVVLNITVIAIHSLRDLATKSELRGRVYGTVSAILSPASIVSMLAGSFLVDLLGVSRVMVSAGLIGFLCLSIQARYFTKLLNRSQLT